MVSQLCINKEVCTFQNYFYYAVSCPSPFLAWIWFVAQIFPVQQEYLRQLVTAITWFIRHGKVCSLPTMFLQACGEDGGTDLVDCTAKCASLFLLRCNAHCNLKFFEG